MPKCGNASYQTPQEDAVLVCLAFGPPWSAICQRLLQVLCGQGTRKACCVPACRRCCLFPSTRRAKNMIAQDQHVLYSLGKQDKASKHRINPKVSRRFFQLAEWPTQPTALAPVGQPKQLPVGEAHPEICAPLAPNAWAMQLWKRTRPVNVMVLHSCSV